MVHLESLGQPIPSLFQVLKDLGEVLYIQALPRVGLSLGVPVLPSARDLPILSKTASPISMEHACSMG